MHVHAHVGTGGDSSICSADIAGLTIVALNLKLNITVL